jgi:hypothetical protein
MKVIITLAIIESIQIVSLFAILMSDTEYLKQEDKMIQSKSDVLRFFIPFFWFMPMIRMVEKWWINLK